MIMLRTLLCAALTALAAAAAQPWDQPFSPDTRAILDAARQIPAAEQGAAILLSEQRWQVHAGGAADVAYRQVFRIDQQSVVDDWSSLEHQYQPWHQQKPQIRARVISANGSVHPLDPKTIAEEPVREYDSTIFSDSRTVRVPLPSVAPGSIVEYEILVRDQAPLLDAGVVHMIGVPESVPLTRFHALIDAAPGVEIRAVSPLIPESAIRRQTDRTGTHIECEWGPREARKDFEPYLPSDVPAYPYLAFSTGASWQAVAARYHSIVNQRTQDADLKPLLDGVDLQGAPTAVAARLAARLHKAVRYTGVEFGENAILPNTPAEVLKRGYGDCKDKATLLVALLRAAGLPADVALLDSGYGMDVDPTLPGMGRFDHAIVYVAANPPLWIDATADRTRVGLLPAADQGRLALIANPATTALVRTPEVESKDNWQRFTLEVHMSDYGKGRIVETEESSGDLFESRTRAAYDVDEKKVQEMLERYVKANYAASSLGMHQAMAPGDLSAPYHTTVEALHAATVSTGANDAAVATTPWLLFGDLPYSLTAPDDDKTASKDAPKPRRNDFVFPEPFQIEYRYRIFPPALFKPNNPPPDQDVRLATGAFSRHSEMKSDGVFEVVYRFDTGRRRINAEQLQAFREALRKYNQRKADLVTFLPATAEYLALGQAGKAVALLRENVAGHPADAMAHARFSRTLISAGLGGAALREARKATELDPKSPLAWQALAWAWQHDTFGRRMQGNWNFAESEKALRKAIELDPDDNIAPTDLAILLEHNLSGWRYAKGARLEEAITLYREVMKRPRPGALGQNLAIALLRAGKLDEAKEEVLKLDLQDGQLMAVITALQEGPARVVLNSQSQYPDPRQRANFLSGVAVTLVQLRHYEPAPALMSAAARIGNFSELQTRADLLAKLKRWEDSRLKEDDPRYPLQRLLIEGLSGNYTPDTLRPLISKRVSVTSLDNGESPDTVMAGPRQDLLAAGFTEETMLDFIISLLELSNEGDETLGYRIRGAAMGANGFPPMFVIKEDGRYRIIGSGPEGWEGIGRLVLDLLAQKNVKAAQWWLDKVVEKPARMALDALPSSGSGTASLASCADLPASAPRPPASSPPALAMPMPCRCSATRA